MGHIDPKRTQGLTGALNGVLRNSAELSASGSVARMATVLEMYRFTSYVLLTENCSHPSQMKEPK